MPFPKGDPEYDTRVRAFRQELEKLGWIDGRNVQLEERWTGDNMDVIRANSTSLMASNPDVVLATGGRVVPILMQLSRSIPIVLPGLSDPVAVGWVTSLALPGGNITDFTMGGMPFQQPAKYALMVNLKVAKVLGLTVPPTLLTLADTVIE